MVSLGYHTEDEAQTFSALQYCPEDSRWPNRCGCGHTYSGLDPYQIRTQRLYAEKNTGKRYALDAVPVGAMWFTPWLEDYPSWHGPDGRVLTVQVPNNSGGQGWIVDSRASNCDSPCKNCDQPYHAHRGNSCPGTENGRYEDARPHKCWVRHGEPPNITVDKNGVTCGAGAGSIVTDGWHGFLRNGQLVL